jgi:hypothetical protein
MTFFNKKTEVMQVEMTPYGRYLYSIGKFKPHSYEFIDDDILYKASGSTESQESVHGRIMSETPKFKAISSFQDEAPQVQSPPVISEKRIMQRKMDVRQPNLFSMGRSSYSSEALPSFQVSMLKGQVSGSQTTSGSALNGDTLIPQVEVDFDFVASLRDSLTVGTPNLDSNTSIVFDDGTYVEISYVEPMFHFKEFNSFYEKENFEIEVFRVVGENQDILEPLKMNKQLKSIVNDLLVDDNSSLIDDRGEEREYVGFYFDFEFDDEIDPTVLCEAVSSIEVNSVFLDEQLPCQDLVSRTDRFDIYATRVGPDDLEDCD